MASKYIKIFNDTVLKQSVLQGYELQRSNENLGTICMGELAFTRDTGRLFVGNYSTQELDLDTKYIGGGILTGNKYIGLIDSRPLCHFNGNGSTGSLPLNYETNTPDRDENKTYPDEIGLFLENSRYRPYISDTKSFKFGGDGWNKKPEYIQKYGVYSGDYLFDIYNNALIIFDKNIKLNTGTPEIKNEDYKETNITNGTLVWNGETETILNSQGEDVSLTSTLRTPITNISDPDDNITQYPIYGDGYVIMRILEPDGITIDYADRKIQDGEPVTNAEDNNIKSYPNWTHNILTVNYPVDKIIPIFDPTNFHKGGNSISLGSIKEGDDNLSITLPNCIEFSDTGWEKTDTYDRRIKFRPLKDYNNSDFVEENPFDDIVEESGEKDSCYLTITRNGQIKYKSPKSVATASDIDELKKSLEPKTHIIKIGDGLRAHNIDTNQENVPEIKLNNQNTNWKLEVKPDEFSIEQTKNGINPWGFDEAGTYNYQGSCGYFNGFLKTTYEYEEDYRKLNSQDFKNVVTDLYESDKLVSVNHLTIPYTLHEGNSNSTAQFTILPYIISIQSTSGNFSCPYTQPTTDENRTITKTLTETYESAKIEDDASNDVITDDDVVVDGEQQPEEEVEMVTHTIVTNYTIIQNYNFEKFTETQNAPSASQIYHRVPKHAHSVLLQIVNSGQLSFSTSKSFDKNFRVLYQTNNAGVTVVEVPLTDEKLLTSTLINSSTLDGEPLEVPSEPDTEYSKTFIYKIESTSNYTIKLLGYRV